MSNIINILITGLGGDIGQSVLKCLKETEYKLRFIGCDVDIYAAAREQVDKFYRAPWASDEEAYITFVDKILSETEIQYIIPTTEPEIVLFNRRREHFAGRVVILINKPHIIDTFFDKYKTVQFFKANGLGYPRTCRIEEYNNEFEFPVILKQRRGCGSKGLIIARDKEEVEFFKKREGGLLVQEIIGKPDGEYTVGVFSTGRTVYSIAFWRFLGYGSLSKIARLVYDEELTRIAEKVARVSHLEGSFNIQLRKTEKGYIPLEVNPRFSSTVYIRHHFGFRDVQWWIDLHEGREIKYSPRYATGVGVRNLNEIFFDCR